jgi:hypothetical protein
MSSVGQVGGGVIVLYTGGQYMKVMVQSKFVINSHKDHALSFIFISYSLVNLVVIGTTVPILVCPR